MLDRDWIIILACLVVILVITAIVAVCSTGAFIATDDPPEPDIEEIVPNA